MKRFFYAALWYGLTPFLALYLLKRAIKQRDYLSAWHERFFGRISVPAGAIWLHAVSVGETHAAAPLIRELAARFPEQHFLITNTTPTGQAAARRLFPADNFHFAYLPYDYPHAVAAFFRRARPRCGLILETELWPNLTAAAQCFACPLFLVNARLSAKSARAYGKIRALIAPTLQAFCGIAAQTAADAERLQALGAPADKMQIFGNLKFDHQPAAPSILTQHLRALKRSIVLLASTREGEEALLLDALPPDFSALVVLVPRHPQRFDDVAAMIAAKNLPFSRRSQGLPRADDAIFLGDSMGELAAFYAAADVAFIGGSLLPLGGQNLIEAAAAGVPIIMGESDFNFAAAACAAEDAGALFRAKDAAAVWALVARFMGDDLARQAASAAGLAFAQRFTGAAKHTADWLSEQLAQKSK